MFFGKLFHKKINVLQGITVTVFSRPKMVEMAACLPKHSCVISINTPGNEHLHIPVPTLYREFADAEDETGMAMADADKVADFVKHQVEKGNYHIYVHCDQGISRSAGIAAAILRAYGKDEGQILDCSDYCINARCYEFVLKAFHVDVADDEIAEARQRSKCAYLNGWPTW